MITVSYQREGLNSGFKSQSAIGKHCAKQSTLGRGLILFNRCASFWQHNFFFILMMWARKVGFLATVCVWGGGTEIQVGGVRPELYLSQAGTPPFSGSQSHSQTPNLSLLDLSCITCSCFFWLHEALLLLHWPCKRRKKPNFLPWWCLKMSTKRWLKMTKINIHIFKDLDLGSQHHTAAAGDHFYKVKENSNGLRMLPEGKEGSCPHPRFFSRKMLLARGSYFLIFCSSVVTECFTRFAVLGNPSSPPPQWHPLPLFRLYF